MSVKVGITPRIIAFALLVALVPMAIAGAVMYGVVKHLLETQTLQNLYTLADVEAKRFARELEEGGPQAIRQAVTPSFGVTGEMYVAQQRGGKIDVVTPLRYPGTAENTLFSREGLSTGESIQANAIDYRGHEVLAVTQQFAPDWALLAKIDRTEAFAPIRIIRNVFLVLAALATLAVLLLASFAGRLLTRPIRELNRAVQAFSQGRLSRRSRVKSADELGELSESFNVMAERLQHSRRDLNRQVVQKTAELSKSVQQLRQQKRRLAREKAHTEAFLQAIGDGLVVVDRHGQIVLTNPPFAQLFGWKQQATIGRHISEVGTLVSERGRRLPLSQWPIARAIKTSRKVRADRYQLRRRDGSRFHLEVTASPIISHGQLQGAVAILRDISDRRALQRRQQQFVSTASHELRTPLTALMGYLSMAQDQKQEAEATAHFTDRAFSAAQRLGRLVEDLLYVTRIDNDKLALKFARFNPGVIIRGELETMQTVFKRKEITLVAEDHLAPSDMIRADRDKFTQAVVNLLDNAAKYTRSGGRVTVATRSVDGRVLVEVNDTGIGIQPANLKRIFDKFYREESELSVAAGGTGLGLPITKELVERQGGTLEIDSQPGQGTTVRLSFKRVRGRRAVPKENTVKV